MHFRSWFNLKNISTNCSCSVVFVLTQHQCYEKLFFLFFFYIFTVTQTTIDTSNHVPHIWPVTRVSPFLMHNYFIVGSPNHLHIFDGLRTQGVRCHVWQHDKHQQRQQCCNHLIVQNPTIGQSTHNPHNSSYLFSKKKKENVRRCLLHLA